MSANPDFPNSEHPGAPPAPSSPTGKRIVLAILVATLINFVLAGAIDEVLHRTGVYPPWGQPYFDAPLWCLALSYRFIITIFAAYVTAAIAKDGAKRALLISGIMGTLLWASGTYFMRGMGPVWYGVVGAVTAIPLVLIGGKIYELRKTHHGIICLTILFSALSFCQDKPEAVGKAASAPDTSISGSLIEPDSLKALLAHRKKGEMLIIHTGPSALYKKGHIPGSVSVGEVGDSAGAATLKEKLAHTPPEKEIVLYCGCCPWPKCPNIRPAYAMAREMGLKKVKVLDIPNSFRIDWEKKGLPVEK
jgi:hypothetical protein